MPYCGVSHLRVAYLCHWLCELKVSFRFSDETDGGGGGYFTLHTHHLHMYGRPKPPY